MPTYSTICKRAKALPSELKVALSRKSKMVSHDASGVKVYGEGEWKRKIHGVGRPRKWLKPHVAIDEDTQDILCEVNIKETSFLNSTTTE